MSATPTDAIVAIATAPGRAAVGIVRISSPRPLDALVHALLRRPLTPRHAQHVRVCAADGGVIDDGLAILFPAPASYTGEHVLELQGHGGSVVLEMVLRRCLEAGGMDPTAAPLRLARPGEFSERAFLNGKLDLAQAEAVADLIDAGSEAAARAAARSLSGAFSREVAALRETLIAVRTWVEAVIDFPDEDIDALELAEMRSRLAALLARCAATLTQARSGALLRTGLHVVIVGQPNAGKSSLLNTLAGSDRAIVTPVPGTTRDVLREAVQINGVPLHIVDTAGLRDSDDPVEQIGIARAWDEIERADVLVFLRDATCLADEQAQARDQDLMAAIRRKAQRQVPVLVVESKADLVLSATQEPRHGAAPLRVSTRTGLGLDALRQALLDAVGWQPAGESGFLARERHVQALCEVQGHVASASTQLTLVQPPLELIAEDLRLAQVSLGAITGAFGADDLLGAIFSTFCIGK